MFSFHLTAPFSRRFETTLYERLARQMAYLPEGFMVGNYFVQDQYINALLITPHQVIAYLFLQGGAAGTIDADGHLLVDGHPILRPGSGRQLRTEAQQVRQILRTLLAIPSCPQPLQPQIVYLLSDLETGLSDHWADRPDWLHFLPIAQLSSASLPSTSSQPLPYKAWKAHLQLDRICRPLPANAYTPYDAPYFFQALQTLTTLPLDTAYRHLAGLFRRLIDQRVEQSRLKFGGLFAKLDFLAKELHFSARFFQQINGTRERLYRLSTLSVAQQEYFWWYDFEAVARLVEQVFSQPLPNPITQRFPHKPLEVPPATEEAQTFVALRLIVDYWDEEKLYGRDEKGASCCAHYAAHHPELRPLLREGAQLHLILRSTSLQESIYSPELIIYEPDYLVDISAIANCFETYAHSAAVHLLRKLQRFTHSHHTLLGNFAGQLLDEAIHHSSISYAESVQTFFKNNALTLATCLDLKPDFHIEAQRQKKHIETALENLADSLSGFRNDLLVVEPSFFSEMLGLQGRMDCLQLDYQLLIEQKAGKGAFPPNDNSDVPRHQEKHYVQLLLYLALLHYNYNIAYEDIYGFLLYSRYAEGLLHLGRAPRLLHEAIAVRNEMVWSEFHYAEGGMRVLEHLTPERLNRFQVHGTLWERYQRPQLEALLSPIQQASDLERAYFFRMMTFVAAEHLAAKVGHNTKENAGFAAKWHDALEEKQQAGTIYDNLQLDLPDTDTEVSEIRLLLPPTADTDTADFRLGDIVVCYPYLRHQVPDIRQTIVFRGTLTALSSDALSVRLNAPQTNTRIFQKGDNYRWAMEHDLYDSSFAHLYRNLQAFLCTTPSRRDLLLFQRPPRISDTPVPLVGNYNSFNPLVQRVANAQDFFLLIGPPGTGKTSYGLLNLLQEALAHPHTHLLLTAYTNRAVDEICSKLVENDIDFLRMGAADSCDPLYHSHLLSERVAPCQHVNDIRQLIQETRVICGTTAFLTANINLFDLKTFDLAIIDEASQILEPQLLGLLSALRQGETAVTKFVLIGDHKQLPAVVQQPQEESRVTDPLLLDIDLTDCRDSLFERLLRRYQDNPAVTYRFTKQGRMHRDIADFPAQMFYGGQLHPVPLPHQELSLQPLSEDSSPITQLLTQSRFAFINCPPSPETESPKSNMAEATLLAHLAQTIFEEQPHTFDPDKTLGIIVPYRGQIATLRAALRRTGIPALQLISIDTVERYQGSQRDVILYGFTIRHPHQLSFLAGQVLVENGHLIDRKLNVALTRARLRLIMVGHAPVLRDNPLFAQLLDYCRQHQAYFESSDYLPETALNE